MNFIPFMPFTLSLWTSGLLDAALRRGLKVSREARR